MFERDIIEECIYKYYYRYTFTNMGTRVFNYIFSSFYVAEINIRCEINIFPSYHSFRIIRQLYAGHCFTKSALSYESLWSSSRCSILLCSFNELFEAFTGVIEFTASLWRIAWKLFSCITQKQDWHSYQEKFRPLLLLISSICNVLLSVLENQ